MTIHATTTNLPIILPLYDSFYKLIYSQGGTAPFFAMSEGGER